MSIYTKVDVDAAVICIGLAGQGKECPIPTKPAVITALMLAYPRVFRDEDVPRMMAILVPEGVR